MKSTIKILQLLLSHQISQKKIVFLNPAKLQLLNSLKQDVLTREKFKLHDSYTIRRFLYTLLNKTLTQKATYKLLTTWVCFNFHISRANLMFNDVFLLRIKKKQFKLFRFLCKKLNIYFKSVFVFF